MSALAETARLSSSQRWARALSLSVACFVSLLLLVDPYVLSAISDRRIHIGLPLTLSGIAGQFIYGLGFEPSTKIPRLVFHPAVAWLLFIVGALIVVRPF